MNLGRVIVGTAFPSSAVTVVKAGDTPTTFNVAAGGPATSLLAGTGETFDYGAQVRPMTVGLATAATAGPVAGTVSVHNSDLTSAGPGTGSADGDDVVSVTGTAVDHATASFAAGATQRTLTLSFGTVALGTGVHALSYSVYDLLGGSGYTAGLDVDAVTGTGSTAALYTSLGPLKDLAAGSSAAFVADLDTSRAGTYAAEFTLAVSDEDIPGAMAGTSLMLDLDGTVGTVAAPEPGGLTLLAVAGACLLGPRRGRVRPS